MFCLYWVLRLDSHANQTPGHRQRLIDAGLNWGGESYDEVSKIILNIILMATVTNAVSTR